MDLTKEIKTRQMENLAMATVKTNDNLDFTKEIKKIIDKAEFYDEAKEAKGKITFQTRETEIEDLVNEIIKVTKSYPKEEFTLEVSYEETNYSSTSVYKLRNGDYEFNNIDHTYIRAEDSLNPPPKAQPLLDEAIRCFKKLDVEENGNSHPLHKHTIELDGEEYKLVVTKEPTDPLVDGVTYRVDKMFIKVPTFKWQEWDGQLPF